MPDFKVQAHRAKIFAENPVQFGKSSRELKKNVKLLFR